MLIDTNIFLRHILRDVETQHIKAKKFFESVDKGKKEGIVSLLVINELVWILERFYKFSRKDFVPQVINLLSITKLKFLDVDRRLVFGVLDLMLKHKLDFTDLYLAVARGNRKVFTFDKDLQKLL